MTTFQRTGHRERLSFSAPPGRPGVRIVFTNRDAALVFLRDIAHDPGKKAALRRVYAELVVGLSSICRESDEVVMKGLARRLVTGELKAWSVVLHQLPPPVASLIAVNASPPPPVAEDPAPDDAWLEIVLLGEEDSLPVGGVKYRVELPDGSIIEGTLDSSGMARFDGIPRGKAKVTFPEIDAAGGGAAEAGTPPAHARRSEGAPASAEPGDDAGEGEPAEEAVHECELTKLEIKAKYRPTEEPESESTVTKLETEKKRRGEKIPPAAQDKLGSKVVELLDDFDLVIEELAGFPCADDEETKGPENVADIEIETTLDAECGHDKHVRIQVRVVEQDKKTGDWKSPTHAPRSNVELKPPPVGGEKDMVLADVEWAHGVEKVAIEGIVAPTFNADIQGGDNAIATLFRMVMWVWHINDTRDLAITAESCRGDLNALVRVYRDVNVAIGVKIPPFKKTTLYEKAGGYEDKGEEEEEEEPELSLYLKFNEIELELSDKTWGEIKEKTEGYVELGKEGLEKGKEGWHAAESYWKKHQHRFAAPAKAKGLHPTSTNLASLKKGLASAFHDLGAKLLAAKEAILGVLDLMKKWPQLGFKIEVGFEFLSGDFFVAWAHAPVDSARPKSWPLPDRYAPLLHKLHLEANISIIKFTAEASFGLLIDAGKLARLEARVIGSVSIEVTWQEMVDVTIGAGAENGEDKLTYELSGKSKGSLRAVVAVKIACFSRKVEIGVETGIVVDGSIEVGLLDGEMSYAVKVYTLETGWYFYTTSLITGEAHVKLHKIFDQHVFYNHKGKLG